MLSSEGQCAAPVLDAQRRLRQRGGLAYPVLSRRSGGLSLGINLFPDAKRCSFDCPYCEVFPILESRPGFSLASLEAELLEFVDHGYPERWSGEIVRDLCFSGNGEPTLSPQLGEALELAARLRRSRPEVLGAARLLVITNSMQLLDPAVSGLLERMSKEEDLVVWAKLDGGSERLFKLMSGTDGGLELAVEGIRSFSRRAPVVIQTMFCEVGGQAPSDDDVEDYAQALSRLASQGARISEVHVYTFARPSPGGRCAALSDRRLLECADRVASATGLRLRCFGASAELARG